MLEGQVAALSSGSVAPRQAISILEALFESDMFREDIHTFMLYPDRELPGFMEKNIVPAAAHDIPLLSTMLQNGDSRIITRDLNGDLRFDASMVNKGSLMEAMDSISAEYGELLEHDREKILDLYEQVFNHKEFTGRSGGMFGFEGLGCVYWHMVSKLLLAVQEIFYRAAEDGQDSEAIQQLGSLYYRVREGLGFNRSPEEYGAFPTDPYSHTPKHAGAQQPGMTGQVKEEIITRFGEFGVRVSEAVAAFYPCLLRRCEFLDGDSSFRYLDVEGRWDTLVVPQDALCFTWCQVPVIYQLDATSEASLDVEFSDGTSAKIEGYRLPVDLSAELFGRTGKIGSIRLQFGNEVLFND